MRSFIKRYLGFFLLLGGIIGLIVINLKDVQAGNSPQPLETNTPTAETTSDSMVFVEVKGAVVYPGVYRLPIGSRIDDAIEAASGTLPEADLSNLNCASKLTDEQIIFVPKKTADEVEQTGSIPEPDLKDRICVDVKGAVENPQMVCLLPGSRVEDALKATGEVTEEADTSSINRSELLKDEMVIVIPFLTDSKDTQPMKETFGYVSIHGEVIRHGLYYVSLNQTVQDIITLAGGLTLNGSTLNLDLNQLLVAGMDILVLTKEEALAQIAEQGVKEPVETESQGDKININTATLAQLETLQGIGSVLAQNIIDYRSENGLFSSIEDIMEVNGIKDSVYAEIKDDIIV